jgi:protein-S-isoprenylcysteine O-methyltransferase Ste14
MGGLSNAKYRIVVRVSAGAISIFLFFGAIFWAAGRLDWKAGWAYLALLVSSQSVVGLCVWRRNPELIKRRARIGRGTKTWDKYWLALFALTYFSVLLVGALDNGRHGWSKMSLWLWPVGAGLHILCLAVITWAMEVNPFFEKTVRIQNDRGHRVIDSGPYRLVRHPGYAGTIVGFILSPPLLLGSWWAFIPATLAAMMMVIRTVLEDRTLRAELPGYEDYARRVRYRLVPGVW